MVDRAVDHTPTAEASATTLKSHGNYASYANYMDSGVEWLGEIPAHWEVTAVKRRYTVQLGKMLQSNPDSADDVEVPYLKALHVQWFRVQISGLPTMWASQKEIDLFGIENGDLLVCEGGEGGRCGIVDGQVDGYVIQNALHRVRSFKNSRNDFLQYVLSAISSMGWFDAMNERATIAHLTGERFGALRIPSPPTIEQCAIAAFLDRETAKIDALIAKKERLIELLQEKRIAVISHAVTKGLDPNVPMKDSGVQWLGEIPVHWDVKRLGHLTPSNRRIMYGIVLPGPHVENGIPIVKGGDVSPERLRLDGLSRTSKEIESRYARSRLHPGDLVYAIRGSIGDVAMVPDELDGANITQDAARVAYDEDSYGLWILYLLKSRPVFAQLEAGALGATIRGINIRDLKRTMIPVPPKTEQQAIADYLHYESARADTLIAKVHEAGDRFRELRAALISAAVTGRIDVREKAA